MFCRKRGAVSQEKMKITLGAYIWNRYSTPDCIGIFRNMSEIVRVYDFFEQCFFVFEGVAMFLAVLYMAFPQIRLCSASIPLLTCQLFSFMGLVPTGVSDEYEKEAAFGAVFHLGLSIT